MSGVGKSAVITSRTVLKGIGNLAIKSGYIMSWPIDLVHSFKEFSSGSGIGKMAVDFSVFVLSLIKKHKL